MTVKQLFNSQNFDWGELHNYQRRALLGSHLIVVVDFGKFCVFLSFSAERKNVVVEVSFERRVEEKKENA